jgi:hypothetical protein
MDVLEGFLPEKDWAKAAGVTQRTTAKYRNEPNGLPYLDWAGKIWIPVKEGREWLLRRVRHPNRRRA